MLDGAVIGKIDEASHALNSLLPYRANCLALAEFGRFEPQIVFLIYSRSYILSSTKFTEPLRISSEKVKSGCLGRASSFVRGLQTCIEVIANCRLNHVSLRGDAISNGLITRYWSVSLVPTVSQSRVRAHVLTVKSSYNHSHEQLIGQVCRKAGLPMRPLANI